MCKPYLLLVGFVMALWCVAVLDPGRLHTRTAPQQPAPPPASGCRALHVAGQGETQWAIANRYAGSQDKHLWLRLMRHVNHLGHENSQLHPGQVVCVRW